MPELPEVEVIQRGLTKTIVGKKIKSVEVRLPRIISVGPKTISNIRKNNKAVAEQFQKILKGKIIESITRRSKLLIMGLVRPLPQPLPVLKEGGRRPGEVEKYHMLIHLKLTGQLIFAKNSVGGLPHKHTHVIFNFTDGSKLFFNDLRQFGYIRLVQDDEVKNIKELQSYGPEPLTRDFSLDYLVKKAHARKKSTIKQFLMEPKVVAGIGNIYSDEILYCAKIRPTRKVGEIKKADWQRLYKCIPQILKEAIKYQGSSVGDFLKADGSEGKYGERHKVYQRAGKHCRKCRVVIKSVKLGGRTSSYCPKCQS